MQHMWRRQALASAFAAQALWECSVALKGLSTAAVTAYGQQDRGASRCRSQWLYLRGCSGCLQHMVGSSARQARGLGQGQHQAADGTSGSGTPQMTCWHCVARRMQTLDRVATSVICCRQRSRLVQRGSSKGGCRHFVTLHLLFVKRLQVSMFVLGAQLWSQHLQC